MPGAGTTKIPPRWLCYSRIRVEIYTRLPFFCVLLVMAAVLAGCGGDSKGPVLYIGGIPDQQAAKLVRRFDTLAGYLSRELDVQVKYVPSVNYAALVSAFRNDDVQLGWFGGLTGVQARVATPESKAIAQRPRDSRFRSVFIVRSGLEVDSLDDLRGLTFTFGSESSTSGHLMPRHYLTQAGVDPEGQFRGGPGYSGSHDKTWKLVESGSFQSGALNEAVWQRAVAEGKVDLSKVRIYYTTPPYFDYNWTIRADIDDDFGNGFTDRVQGALLAMDPREPEHKKILDLFQAERFIASSNDNYLAIEEVARRLDIIR